MFVQLTHEELKQRGEMLADTTHRLAEMEAEKAAFNKDWKEAREPLLLTQAALVDAIRTGGEFRDPQRSIFTEAELAGKKPTLVEGESEESMRPRKTIGKRREEDAQ